MRWNDDIVNQKILGVDQTDKGFELSLTNGMYIELPVSTLVLDAGVYYPIERWVTYKDGEVVRKPMPRPIRRSKEFRELVDAAQQVYDAVDIKGDKVCPHGNSGAYPIHGWFCDDCLFELRDALAHAKEVGRE